MQNGKDLISSVPADVYANRFFNFMRMEVIVDDKETREQRGRFSLTSSRNSEIHSMRGIDEKKLS